MIPAMPLLAALASLFGGTARAQESPAAASDRLRDSLQQIVAARVAAGHGHALIAGLVPANGGRFVVAAGNARPGVPVDEQTVFEIGSITKVFTGILLADMMNRGEVRFDTPVAALLPAGTSVPVHNGRAITLGDLATQVSGLPRLPDNMHPADEDNPYADYTVAQMYEFLRGHTLRRAPGDTYEYTNLGVGLLGHALALRAGKSYEELVRERILEPLGMRHTGIALTESMRARVADGHSADGDVVSLWDLPTFAGAGALRSSMADMLRFLDAVRTPGDDAVGRAIALSQRPRYRVNGALSLGLNWHISNFRGDTMVWHNGGTAGFRSMLAVHTGTRAGVVLLGNSAHDNDDLVRHLLMRTPLATIVARTEIAVAPEALQAYEGTYQLTPSFAITITVDGGALYAQATAQPRLRLYAEAPDKFFLKVVDAQIEFERNASGVITGMTLVQNGRQFARKVR